MGLGSGVRGPASRGRSQRPVRPVAAPVVRNAGSPASRQIPGDLSRVPARFLWGWEEGRAGVTSEPRAS